MKRKAFTLIELLITATLLVVVGGYAVVIFSSTAALSYQSARSAGAISQSRKALEVIAREFSQSDPAQTVTVLASSELNTQGSVFIHTVRISNSAGELTANIEKRIYCAQPVAGSNPTTFRLARFKTTATYSQAAGSILCNASSISQTLFSNGQIDGPEFMTDEATNVARFMAVPTQFSSSPASPFPGVRLILTTAYDPTLSTGESRADVQGSARYSTLQVNAVRNFPYITPFSGL